MIVYAKLLLPCLLLAMVLPATALTLPEAQQILLSKHPDVQIARKQIDISRLALREATAAWQPTATAFASYQYQSEVPKVVISTPPPMALHITEELGGHDRTDFGGDVSWAAFTGLARYRNIQASKASVQSNQEQLAAIQNTLSLQLGTIYYLWDLSTRIVAVQQALVDEYAAFAGQTKTRRQAGVATVASVAQADARLQEAKTDLLSARIRVDSLALEIAYFIHVTPAEARLDTLPPLDEAADLATPPVDSFVTPAGAKALDAAAAQLGYSRQALLARCLPYVTLSTGYRLSNPGLNETGDQFMDWTVFGAQIGWTLYDGLKVKNERAQVKAQADIVQISKNALLDNLHKNAEIARMRLEQGRAELAAARLAVDAAKQSADAVKAAVDGGTKTTEDYLSASSSLAAAQARVNQAVFSLRSAHVALLYASGRDIVFK